MSQQLPHWPPGSSPWQPGWPTQPLEPPHKPPIYTRAWVILAAVLGMLGLGVIACTALILAISASAPITPTALEATDPTSSVAMTTTVPPATGPTPATAPAARLATPPTTATAGPAPSTRLAAPPPRARTMLRTSGNGYKKTRKFTVDDTWEIRYRNRGGNGIFQLYLYDADNNLAEVAANTQEPGTDIWPGTLGGTFYLQVNTTGTWSLEVVDTP
jgi:hypothetical protein